MSLKSEIDRTETEKNKTKQVATNIDNKLIELGGEQAMDLNDVPNKIELLVKEYNKLAIITMNKRINIKSYDTNQQTIIPIELNFIPKKVFVDIYVRDELHNRIIRSDTHTKYGDYTAGSYNFWIGNFTNTKVEFMAGLDGYLSTDTQYIQVKRIIAFG